MWPTTMLVTIKMLGIIPAKKVLFLCEPQPRLARKKAVRHAIRVVTAVSKATNPFIAQTVQFSTTNPGTSAKSFSFLVTTVRPCDKAWAAIRRSKLARLNGNDA